MLRILPPTLFEQDKPLRAAAWNELVDASEELVDVWSGEHVNGRQHASPRLESAGALLEWDGSAWWPVEEDRIHVVSSTTLGDRAEVEIEFGDHLWGSRLDYAVFAQGNDGCPGIVPWPAKSREGFVLVLPAGSESLQLMTVVVIGREYVAE